MTTATEELTDIHTISVYVANKPGVLARIAQSFARRGYNIDSLVVSPSKDGEFSRMTIAAQGSVEGLDQIIKQTNKLIDVIHCTDHTDDDAVVRELALIKIEVTSPDQRTEALQIAEHFGCKSVDLTKTSMIVMAFGASDKVDACLRMFDGRIIELIRTGKVVMARGDEVT